MNLHYVGLNVKSLRHASILIFMKILVALNAFYTNLVNIKLHLLALSEHSLGYWVAKPNNPYNVERIMYPTTHRQD